ncbi:MAG: hypothetical protein J7L34_00145 [Thermotogaceae bacterium]|nr:hypothetical protein [Thermotogaceae bacterium]
MLIGAKVGGKVYSRESAERLLYSVKEDLKESCSKLSFSSYFTSIRPNLVFSRSEWKGEAASLNCEYRKFIRVDVEITSSRATTSEVVFDVERSLFVEVSLKGFDGIFYFKPYDDYFDSVKSIFRCSFFDVCRLNNYPEKFKVSLQILYELFSNFDGIEIDGEVYPYGNRYGGVNLQLDRIVKYREQIEEEIKRFIENVISGRSTGVFGGLDSEVIQMRQMMEKTEEKLLINSARLIFYSSASGYSLLNHNESFVGRFKSGKVKLSNVPLEFVMNVQPGGEEI